MNKISRLMPRLKMELSGCSTMELVLMFLQLVVFGTLFFGGTVSLTPWPRSQELGKHTGVP
jgi:hypothetical protein